MDDTFQAYSPEHLLLMAISVAGCFVMAWLGRRVRGGPREMVVRRSFAVLILLVTVPLQVTLFLPGEWNLHNSLPLQICDLSWMMAVAALLTRDPRAIRILYYWGLVLNLPAILTPDLVEVFPHPRYLMFWGMHFLSIWAAAFCTFGLGVRPTWRGLRLAVVATSCWAGAVMVFNAIAGTNYGYLNRKPPIASPLDFMGPWPFYVLVEIAVVVGIFALITWPWERRRVAVPA